MDDPLILRHVHDQVLEIENAYAPINTLWSTALVVLIDWYLMHSITGKQLATD